MSGGCNWHFGIWRVWTSAAKAALFSWLLSARVELVPFPVFSPDHAQLAARFALPGLRPHLTARLEAAPIQVCSSAVAARVEPVPFPIFSPDHPQLAGELCPSGDGLRQSGIALCLDLPRAYALGLCLPPLRGWSLLILAE